MQPAIHQLMISQHRSKERNSGSCKEIQTNSYKTSEQIMPIFCNEISGSWASKMQNVQYQTCNIIYILFIASTLLGSWMLLKFISLLCLMNFYLTESCGKMSNCFETTNILKQFATSLFKQMKFFCESVSLNILCSKKLAFYL